jgi:phosphoribosylamine--glycine ligase
MKVCVVGSGAREHALAEAIAKSAESVVVVPGNAGIKFMSEFTQNPKIICSSANPLEIDAELFVIGPEQPLWEGLAELLRKKDKFVVGPNKDGARLEASKAWMKQVLKDANIPTAPFGVFQDFEQASSYLKSLSPPYVIKTDGLAQGKGVLVTNNLDEAIKDAKAKLSGEAFGDAGKTIVIEEGLIGQELSVMALCDSKRISFFGSARDYKRLLDNDNGPNTGGMGAFSPVNEYEALIDISMDKCVEPLVYGLRKKGVDYRGIIYAGLMIVNKEPYVLEINVRLGDPEAQVILPRVDDDLVSIFYSIASGDFNGEVTFSSDSAVGVVLASEGYPYNVKTGVEIQGWQDAISDPSLNLYFAGVSEKGDKLITSAGRVLTVVGKAKDGLGARNLAYQGIKKIYFENMHFRRDIYCQANA